MDYNYVVQHRKLLGMCIPTHTCTLCCLSAADPGFSNATWRTMREDSGGCTKLFKTQSMFGAQVEYRAYPAGDAPTKPNPIFAISEIPSGTATTGTTT